MNKIGEDTLVASPIDSASEVELKFTDDGMVMVSLDIIAMKKNVI